MSAPGSAAQRGVICAGALVLDTLVRPYDRLQWGTTTIVDTIEPRVGGSAANTARALGILGVPARVAAVLGRDQAAKSVRQELSRCAVDTSCIQMADEPTAQTVVLISPNGDRQFLHRRGCSDVAFRDGLAFTAELLAGISHFHVASLYLLPHLRRQAPSMLRTARERGLTTSLDTCWDPHNEWTQVLEPCLPNLDILFMNEDEATQIASGRTMEVLARAVMEQGPAMVVIKLGREGCRIYTATQNVICPAYDVEARDTTGAGDCFVAGFLAAYLDGASAERAGSMGNGTGALSVQQIGAVDGLLPRPEQEAWMARTALRRGERGPAGA